MNAQRIMSFGLVFLLVFGGIGFAKPLEPATRFGAEPIITQSTDGLLTGIYAQMNESRGIQEACDRMVESMCPAECNGAGWPWPLPPCPAPESVPGNTLGPAGVGLLHGYGITSDIDHLIGAFDAGDYAKCYSYGSGEPRFATGTPYFLWLISDMIPSATSYEQYAIDEFFVALENGTYGAVSYDTAGFITAIETSRSGDHINLRPYESTDLLKAAYLMGSQDQWEQFAVYSMDAIEMLTPYKSWDVTGLAAGVFTMAFSHIDFDPQSGYFADEDSVWDLAIRLASLQHSNGGFPYALKYQEDVPPEVNWTYDVDHWYSGSANVLEITLTKQFTPTATTDISFDTLYSIEAGWDYGYVEYSTDGDSWTNLATYDGCQDTYVNKTMNFPSLDTYYLRFRYSTDAAVEGQCPGDPPPFPHGWYVKNITVDGVTDDTGWTVDYVHPDLSGDPPIDSLSLQTSVYAVLALKAVDPWYFESEINAGVNWIMDRQLANGGFETYTGEGEENCQVDGEALWAINFAPDCWNDGDVNNSQNWTPEDSQYAFWIYLGKYPFDLLYHDFCSADANDSGDVTPADALCIWEAYLGLECLPADPIIIPPSNKSGEIAHELYKGALIVNKLYNANTQTLQLNIYAANDFVDVDSFGLNVYMPEGINYRETRFGNMIQDFRFIGANAINANTIRVGGFDTDVVIPAGSNDLLISMSFDVTDSNAIQDVRLFNLVDDIQGFDVIFKSLNGLTN